jgi:hypothetical protein
MRQERENSRLFITALFCFLARIPRSARRSTAEYQPLTATTATPAIIIASINNLRE